MKNTLLAELGLTLLHGGHEHVSRAYAVSRSSEPSTARRESVETSTPARDRNDVQILGTRVISAVDHSAHRETETHSELVSSSTTTSYELDHDGRQNRLPRLAAAILM